MMTDAIPCQADTEWIVRDSNRIVAERVRIEHTRDGLTASQRF